MSQYDRSSRGAHLRKKKKKKKNKALTAVMLLLLTILLTGIALAIRYVRPPDAGSGGGGSDVLNEEILRIDGADRKDDFITVLIVGADAANSGNNTDTIMLAAYDMANNKISLLSIPRDTMINVDRKNKKINAAYGTDGGKNINELMSEVESVVGFRPDRYVIVGLDGFVKMIDTIGGVTLDVPIDMKYSDPAQDLTIDIKKGYQTLDGYDAMGFMRFRSTYLMGDLDRIEMQHKFIDAFARQMFRAETIGKVPELASLFMEYVDTDLTTGNMIWMAQRALSMDPAKDFEMYTLPGEAQYYKKLSYFIPYKKQTLALINERFNPYRQKLTKLNLAHVLLANQQYSDELERVEEKPTRKSENGGAE